jgi:hypothetical protein
MLEYVTSRSEFLQSQVAKCPHRDWHHLDPVNRYDHEALERAALLRTSRRVESSADRNLFVTLRGDTLDVP